MIKQVTFVITLLSTQPVFADITEQFLRDYSAERYEKCQLLDSKAITLLMAHYEGVRLNAIRKDTESVIERALIDAVSKIDTESLTERQELLTATQFSSDLGAICLRHHGEVHELKNAIENHQPVIPE